MNQLILALIGMTLLLGQVCAQRDFTDQKGRILNGTILNARSDKVTLKLKSGRTTTFSVKLLSDADQQYVERWKEDNPDIKLDIQFQKKLLTRKKTKTSSTETWRYDIVVTNRGFEAVKDLEIQYVQFNTIHDRYSKARKRKHTSVASDGKFLLEHLRRGKRKTFETKSVTVQEKNKVTTNTYTISYEKWDESLSGITVDVIYKGRVVDSKTSGLARDEGKRPAVGRLTVDRPRSDTSR